MWKPPKHFSIIVLMIVLLIGIAIALPQKKKQVQERYKVLSLENRPAALMDLQLYLNSFGENYRLASTIVESPGYGYQPHVHLIFEHK